MPSDSRVVVRFTSDQQVQRTHADGRPRMLADCARRNLSGDDTHQACCRFPKTCSPYPFPETPVTDDDLEPRRGPAPDSAERQTWERHIPGTDVPELRIVFDIEPDGRVRLHEAVVAQLLDAAGWERTA